MSTKKGTDGGVHSCFTFHPGSYDAYIHFMNVLADFQILLRRSNPVW